MPPPHPALWSPGVYPLSPWLKGKGITYHPQEAWGGELSHACLGESKLTLLQAAFREHIHSLPHDSPCRDKLSGH